MFNRLVLIFLLLFAPLHAQTITPQIGGGIGFGFDGGISSGSSSSASLVLPTVASAPLVVFSSVKSSTYSGPWANLLRASDSTTQNISFANGIPSQSALTAFQGASSLRTAILYDQSGNGFNATGTGVTIPPIAPSSVWNGIQPTTFDGAAGSTTRELSLPAGLTATSQSVSIFAVVRPLASFQASSYAQIGASGSNYLNFWQVNGQTDGPGVFDGTTQIFNPSFKNQVRDQPTIIGVTSSATGTTFYIDNIVVTAGVAASHATAGGLIGAWSGGNAGNLSGDHFALLVYPTALSTTDAAKVITSLQAAYPGTARTATRNLVYDGDSIMFGAGLIGSGNTPNIANISNLARQTEPLLNFSVNSWNVALDGATLATEAAGYSVKIAPLFDATKLNNIMFQEGGSNDILASVTAATLETTITNNAAAAHATGYKFICMTILPRSTFTTAMQTEWNNYNAFIRASGTSICDAIADEQADPTIGPLAATSNTALYVDGTHLSPLGYSFAAPILAAAINGVVLPPTSCPSTGIFDLSNVCNDIYLIGSLK